MFKHVNLILAGILIVVGHASAAGNQAAGSASAAASDKSGAAVAPTPAKATVPAPGTVVSAPPAPIIGETTLGQLANAQGAALIKAAAAKNTPAPAAMPVPTPLALVPALTTTAVDGSAIALLSKPAAKPQAVNNKISVAAIVGFAGAEQVEFHVGDVATTLKPGDSVSGWRIVSVQSGRITVKRDATPSNKREAPARVLSVGEVL